MPSALAASPEPAGSAVAVVQQANANLDGKTAPIAQGDGIFVGQQVITGNAGSVQVLFQDQTHLVIGPGSSLLISQYLMRGDNTASKFVINALGGTFRFVTGNSAKNAYQINTPTGTIGVRGTAFDLSIEPGTGEARVMLYHGGVLLCPTGAQCRLMSESCAVGVLPDGRPANVLHRDDQQRDYMLRGFPYLKSQQPLRDDFRVAGTLKCKEPRPARSLNSNSYASAPPPCPPPPCPPPPCGHGLRYHYFHGPL